MGTTGATGIKEIENLAFGLDLSGSEQKVISQLKTLQKVLNVTIHFIYIDTPTSL